MNRTSGLQGLSATGPDSIVEDPMFDAAGSFPEPGWLRTTFSISLHPRAALRMTIPCPYACGWFSPAFSQANPLKNCGGL